jgi:hypothetical protein
MGKPQAASGGVGDPIELAGGAAVQTADFEPPCPRNIAQNDARRRRGPRGVCGEQPGGRSDGGR